MSVIREDIVSIGFDVQQNPFAELTTGINEIKMKLGILNEAESGLRDVGREAGAAGVEMESLADSIHAPPTGELAEPLSATGDAAVGAARDVTRLNTEMEQVGDQDLSAGVEGLSDSIHEPVSGFQDLLGNAKQFVKEKLSDGVKALGTGLQNPKEGFKNLLGTAKQFVKEKLDTGIKTLPPQLQIAVRAGGLLLKGLGKVAKLTFGTAVSGLKSLASHAGSAAKSLAGASLKAVGKGAIIGITAASTALAGGAVAAYNFGSAYETSLAKVSTMVDTSVKSVAELSSDVMNLSNKTGEDASGLNDAVYQALSAGAKTDQVVGLVETAVKAARGGFTDTTTAIDGLTSTLNAYGMETQKAEGLANSFLITQNKGKTTFGELASSIGTVAPTASAAGVGVDELLSGVASLTANGIGTSEAMTGMKAALSNVIKPSGEASKMAKSLGLEFNTTALQSKGLVGFLDSVKTATGGNMDQMAQLFGSVEALNTVLTLTSDNGMSLMKDTMNEMETNTKALDTAYETMSDTAQVSIQKGLNTFKNLGIGIYQSSEGIVSDLTGLFASSGEELYSAFQSGGFDGLVGQIGTTLSNVLIKLTGYLPSLIQGGVSIVNSLISGIMQNREQITQSVTEGVTMLLAGLVQMVPQLLTAGIMMLGSLLQGIEQQLPALGTTGMSAITNLCNGIAQSGPAIIRSGINILMYLVNGLIAALPTIISTGMQLVGTLAQGLIGALPDLVSAAIQLVGGLVKAFFSINWLELGWDIIKGVGNGVVKGFKGLFGGGKDAGAEVGEGLAAGMNEGTSLVTTAACTTTTMAKEGFLPDTTALNGYGLQMPEAVSEGIQSGAGTLQTAAGTLGTNTSNAMLTGLEDMENTAPIGQSAALNLAGGISSNKDLAISEAAAMGQEVTKAATPSVNVTSDMVGAQSLKAEAQSMVEDSKATLEQLSPVFEQAYHGAAMTVAKEMASIRKGMKTTLDATLTDTQGFKTGLTSLFSGISLYQTGVNIMSGLNRGMLSMRSVLMGTAASTGKSISDSLNGSLDIRSPSRVTEETGEYTGLGLIKGIRNTTGEIKAAARDAGDVTARNIAPFKSRYSPETSAAASTRSTSQTNNYSPVFNLTLNGASASDSNERKVKRWVRDAMKESVEGMGRTNPRLQEV